MINNITSITVDNYQEFFCIETPDSGGAALSHLVLLVAFKCFELLVSTLYTFDFTSSSLANETLAALIQFYNYKLNWLLRQQS